MSTQRSGDSSLAEYKDFFGQPIELDDIVLGAYVSFQNPEFALYKVIGFNPKTVKVLRMGTKKPKPANRRPDNVYKVDPKLLTLRGIVK